MTTPTSTPPPAITSFFYQQPVVLNREQHKGLRLKAAGAAFAAKSQSVPLLASEFAHACLEYPIVFVKGAQDQWLALALTGLKAQVNAFVDAQGQWLARYVPASVRRYPFILAQGENDQLSLAADLSSPHLGQEGEALFDEQGEPTDLMRKIMPMLADFQKQSQVSAALTQKLSDAGLLKQQNLQVKLGDGRNAVVDGVWIVDEVKLRELPDDQVLALFRGGELNAVHAHMLSLRNLVPLLERSQPAVANKPAEPRKPAELAQPVSSGKLGKKGPGKNKRS